MRAVGLITEYNPFHNGHLHHLRESRRAAGAKVAVAVMSGHFLQRGEPALTDKWVRAGMALAAGVDLVVELPFPWACNSAPFFALGAVQALDALGGIDSLCFGSEAGVLAPLEECARLLIDGEGEVAKGTAELLRKGVNYPEARARVAGGMAPDSDTAGLLGFPNNILGIEYLKALRATRSSIRPFTIIRTGAGYHDIEAVGEIASATGIRRMLGEGREVEPFIPSPARELLGRALAEGRFLDSGQLHNLLLARLFRGPDSIRGLYQIEEGIEERLCGAADVSADYGDLVGAVKSRHFTRTRIQRLLCYVLNEVEGERMSEFLEAGPLYLHVLGFRERGRAFLAACRKSRSLPLVQNYSRIHAALKRRYGVGSRGLRLAEGMLELEVRATRNYSLLMKQWSGGNRNRDFFEEVIKRSD